jgi:hypothetical protein
MKKKDVMHDVHVQTPPPATSHFTVAIALSLVLPRVSSCSCDMTTSLLPNGHQDIPFALDDLAIGISAKRHGASRCI